MDLISRSELVKLLEDRKREHYENYESFRNYMGNRRLEHETEYEECKRILTIVANQPTVEAKSVVNGEWISNGWWRNCSQCGEIVSEIKQSNFCPNCGCKMKK